MKLQNVTRLAVFPLLVYLILLASFGTICHSKSCDGHITDWYDLFGIDKNVSKDLKPLLFKPFCNQIDVVWPTPFYRKLRHDFPDFNTGRDGHRLLFHWGFSTDPCNSNRIKDKMTGMRLSSERKDEFCDRLRQEQGRRNRIMLNAVRMCTGLPRKQSVALATLIYNTHILVDYSNIVTSPLADLALIHKDTKDAIKWLNFDSADQEMLLRKLDADQTQNVDETGQARSMLSTLKRYLPPLLYKRWGHTLGNRGIVIEQQKREMANDDSSISESAIRMIKDMFNLK